MSIQSKQNEVDRHTRKISDLKKKYAEELHRKSLKENELVRVTGQLSSTKSVSSARSYMQKIPRIQKDLAALITKQANIERKIADARKALNRAEQNLAKEQMTEKRKISEMEKRRRNEQLTYERGVRNHLQNLQKAIASTHMPATNECDVFICHASEDKESFVRPLSEKLKELGLRVWYDESSLAIGDSLRRKIDEGLQSSRYGIVVLSEAFFAKEWPQRELDGLVAKEGGGSKVILPIWHKISKDEVIRFSPTLADKVALNTTMFSVQKIAEKISETVTSNSK